MKVTLKEVISAVPSLQKLYRMDLPLSISYRVYQLSQAINTKISFFTQRREQILRNPERKAELDELLEQDAELDRFGRIKVRLSDDYLLSPADIENLSKFIEFELEDKNNE